MKSFGTLLKNFHLCRRANGLAPYRIRIPGTKNFEAFSSYLKSNYLLSAPYALW